MRHQLSPQSISICSIFLRPDSVLPDPEKGTAGFDSAAGRRELDEVPVELPAGEAPRGAAAAARARPDNVLP